MLAAALTTLLPVSGFVPAPRAAPRAAPAWRGGAAVRMAAAGGAAVVDGVRIGPPPDLPSLLLHNRIVYCGMALAPSVSELMVAELLYLNFESNEKPVYMYINSPGTAGFETEAFAIIDTMNYIGPEVETIGIGTAFGTAAMLLANGKKGSRTCLPNSMIMLSQPRSKARGQASDIKIQAREVLANRLIINTILSEKTGQPIEKIVKDSSRTKYMTADQALQYGIVDKVLRSEDDLPTKPTFLSSL